MNMNQRVKAGYDKAARNYSSEFREQFKNEKHLEQLVQVLPEKAVVLDVGCGAGKPIDTFLVSKGMRVIGIDISEAQIALAKENVPEARYEVCDMSQLEVGSYQVEAIVSFYAIFHTLRKNHFELLKRFKSLLKPNGYLLITMGASDWEGKEDNFCGAEMYWSHYGPEKNKELIQKAGFEIIFAEIDKTGGEEHLVVLAKAK